MGKESMRKFTKKQAHTFLKNNWSLDRKGANGKEKDDFLSFFLRLLEGKARFFLNKYVKRQ